MSSLLYRLLPKSQKKNSRWLLLFAVIFLVTLVPVFLFTLRNPGDARAGWFNDHYGYRQQFSFTHNAAINEARAVTFTLDTAELITDGVMQADCDDTRFTDANGTELEFDLTGTCNNASTTYEVIFPSIINGTQYAYVYYGNPSASSGPRVDSTQYTALTPSGGDPGAITDRTSEESSPGPSASWSFDEGIDNSCPGGSNDACDGSGNDNDGAFGATTAAPTWQTEDECISGKCVYFDGSDDYMQFPSSNTFSTSAGTVSMWVKANGSQATPSYIFSHPQIGDFSRVYLSFQDGGYTVDCIVGGISQVIGTYTLSDSQWTHLACTWDGTSTAFYVNGVDQTTLSSIVALSSIATDSYLGSWDGTQEYFNGSIDEARIYPYARTATEIKQDYNNGAGIVLGAQDQSSLSNGLVGYWPMDESSGTNVQDSSGNGNDGTLTNAQETGTSDGSGNSTTTLIDTDGTLSSTDDAYNGMILFIDDDGTCGLSADEQRLISDYDGTTQTFTVSTAFSAAVDTCVYEVRHQVGGKFGNGLSFESEDDVVTGTLSSSIANSSFTLSGWLLIHDNTDTNQALVSLGSQAAANKSLVIRATTVSSLRFGNYLDSLDATVSTLQEDTWYQITGTYNADTGDRKLYLNGELVGQDVTTNDYTGGNNFTFGKDSWAASGYLYGNTDAIRIYNRSLTPAEVKNLYNWAPGPVGHWDFEEGSGTTVSDSSNGGSDMNLTSTEFTQGKFGHGVTFPTSSAYALIADTTDSPLDMTTAITTEAWVYLDQASDVQTFLYRKGGANDYYFFITNTLRVGCYIRGVGSFSSDGSYPISLNEWTHITCSYDGASVKTYVNGILRSNNAATGLMYTSNASVEVGNTSSTGNNYRLRGVLDELKIYNYARSQEQILADMGGSSSQVSGARLPKPLAYWAFDEMSGQTVNNSSSWSGAIGSLSSTLGANSTSSTDDPSWTDAESCKNNSCLSFDGGDYIIVSDDSTLSPGTGNQTISAWFNTTTNHATTGWIYSNYGTTTNNVAGLAMDSSERLTCLYRDGSANTAQATTTDTWNDGAWHRAACVRDGTTARLYVDGVEVATNTNASLGTITTTTRDISIGSYAVTPTSQYFTGLIDEVKIYNIALSQTQINQDMNAASAISFGSAGTTKKSLVTGTWTAPVGHWSFDDNGGSSAKDVSGNGYTGSLTTMTDADWVPGKVGRALEFDGSSDYVDVGAGPTSVKSVSFWVYPMTTTEYFINLTSTTDYIWVNAGTLTATGFSSPTIYVNGQVSSTITAGNWHHVVVTSETAENASNLDLGRTADANYLQGKLDQVKLWDSVLTPAQIAYEYNQGKPIAHWQFDECQGTTAYDASGNDNHGTISIGATGTNTSIGTCNSGTSTESRNNGTTGKINASLDFDGTNDYVNIYSSSLNTAFDPEHGSISLFAKVGSSATWTDSTLRDLINLRSDISNYIRIGKSNNDNDLSFLYSAGGTIETLFPSDISHTDWMHIVMTWDKDADLVGYYLNGTLIGTDTNLGTWSGSLSSSGTTIGSYSTAPITLWDGQIDDVRLYNYALSAAQVKQLQNGGAVSFE